MRDDPELIGRARSQDPEALGELYDSYAPQVYAYVYRRVSDPEVAEDLTGEVFVRVVMALHAGRTWHTSFRAWLYRVAHNLVVDHYRRRAPEPLFSADETLAAADQESIPDRKHPSINTTVTYDNHEVKVAVGTMLAFSKDRQLYPEPVPAGGEEACP